MLGIKVFTCANKSAESFLWICIVSIALQSFQKTSCEPAQHETSLEQVLEYKMIEFV